MKILIVSFTFPPNKDGVSEAASAMALGFVSRGWEVEVLTEATQSARSSNTWNGVAIREFRYTNEKPWGILVDGADGEYTDFLKAGNWDVILIHIYGLTLRLAIPVFNQIRSRKILVSHGYAALQWIPQRKFPFGLRYWSLEVIFSIRMLRWIHSFDRVVYLDELADFGGFFDHLIAKAVGYTGRRVIPNGIDLNERGNPESGFRQKHGVTEDAFVFLCLANYSTRKDQGYAARAFRKAAIPGSVLIFIGSEFNEHSKKFMEEDGRHESHSSAGRILWLEKQDRQSTLDALATCDAFVLSANHEAQPIAMLEAMRESKPWIARKAGCIASMEGGICVKSETEMALTMRKLASNAGLREHLGHTGHQAVETRYNREAYVDSYCNLIEEIVPAR